jgi:hypothetical protein
MSVTYHTSGELGWADSVPVTIFETIVAGSEFAVRRPLLLSSVYDLLT